MDYQKIISLLNDTTNQLSKFRTRNWIEINDESRGRYDNSSTRFKTFMIRIYVTIVKFMSNLYDYSDALILAILVKGPITVPNTVAVGTAVNNTNKKVIFKNCAPSTDCISKINNTEVDDAQKVDFIMPMYNLIEYNDPYSKTSGSLLQYYRDKPALNNNGEIIDFLADNNSVLFKFKKRKTG